MFRPRESHDLRLVSADLKVTPAASAVRWIHDVFDNSIAVVSLSQAASSLCFESTVRLEHFEVRLPDYPLEEYAVCYPFEYSDDDRPQLDQALRHHYPTGLVPEWAARFANQFSRIETLALLRAMTLSIKKDFKYSRRAEKGVKDPSETIASRTGTCRDYAVLMMEAARALGLAARFVSGYIFVPSLAPDSSLTGGGSTHAWVQIYLPGAGWVDFDPTNDIVGNRNLIRVAFAWDHKHVLPLWGTYYGKASAFEGMDVTVRVTEEEFATIPA
jgi:transglutaminase-like putative cysteine protease